MKIGLVGLGRMGGAIWRRLTERGCEVIAWDGNSETVQRHAADGLNTVGSPREVAESAGVVISIITEDNGVRGLFRGKNGFLEANLAGKLFIEMSTCQPMTSRELAPEIEAKGARIVDVPVLGTIPNVKNGTLTGLAGGDAEDIERARAVLGHLTQRIFHMGPLGCGCAMKLSVNSGMIAYMQSLAESFALGQRYGLNVASMIEVIEAASPIATPWLKVKTPMLTGKGGPISLDIVTMRKDVMSAVATGAKNGVPMPVAAGALSSLSAAVAQGWGDKDIAELPKFFRDNMLQNFGHETSED